MMKKLNMSKQGWGFAIIFFILAAYYTFTRAHFAGWKSVKVTFHFLDGTVLLSSLVSMVTLLLFYIICTLLPSRRIVIIPTIFTLLLAGQELALSYYTLPVGDILGGLVVFVGTILLVWIAYLYAQVSFAVIDTIKDADEGNYFSRWIRRVKISVVKEWRALIVAIILYALLNASIVMTLTLK